MPMLRDDRQVALNDVIVLCRDAADHYRDAAALLERGEPARLLDDLARRRAQAADELARHSRQLGDLPDEPDPDKETVDNLLTRLKALFVEDERRTVLAETEQIEAQIAAAAAAALGQPLPDTTLALLRRLEKDIQATRRRLVIVRTNL